MKKLLSTILLVVIFILTAKPVDAAGLCRASDISSFKNCLNLVNNGTVDNVEITSMITCSGPDACKFILSNSNWPVWIYGSANIEAGFKRIDNYNYFLFEIKNAAGINISNLHLDESANGDCTWTYPQMQCSSPIHIEGSNNITLDSLKIDYAKAMGVEILGSNNVTIRSSIFNNTRVAGVWTGWGTVLETVKNQGIHVENNTFQNSGVEAVGLHVAGLAHNRSTLTGNTFINNQWHPLYFFCGANGNGACSGGQVFINHASYILVERNIIKNGSETDGLGTSGIEIDTADNVEIRNNDIHDNSGTGIIIEPGQTAGPNLVIGNNRVFNNLNGNINVPGAILNNNCFTAGCLLNLPIGTLSAVPDPCLLSPGNTACTSAISWTTTGAQNVSVTADGVLFAANDKSSSKDAPWIPAEGRTFKLYDGSILLDTLFVRGLTNSLIVPIPGNLNGDGHVNIFDYNLFIPDFGKTGTSGWIPSDIDRNGSVNIFDYNLLVQNFGKFQ